MASMSLNIDGLVGFSIQVEYDKDGLYDIKKKRFRRWIRLTFMEYDLFLGYDLD